MKMLLLGTRAGRLVEGGEETMQVTAGGRTLQWGGGGWHHRRRPRRRA
jgi:hypothetical protein